MKFKLKFIVIVKHILLFSTLKLNNTFLIRISVRIKIFCRDKLQIFKLNLFECTINIFITGTTAWKIVFTKALKGSTSKKL